MSSLNPIEDPSRPLGKGKHREIEQEPTEQTPLLGGTSQLHWSVANDSESPAHSSRALWSKLTTVFFISLSICILAFVVLALLAWSYAARATNLTPEHIINHDLVFRGPDRLNVINITSDGAIWVNVEGRIGMDVGAALGINSDQDDWVLQRLWKAIGRQSVRTLDRVSVEMSTVSIMPEFDSRLILSTVKILPLEVALTVDPPTASDSWLAPVSIPVLVHPTTNSTLLIQFLRESWSRGSFAVRADVAEVFVRGGALDGQSWRAKFRGKLSNIRTSLRLKVPVIPGFPHPGHNVPLPSVSDLITLRDFNVYSSPSNLTLAGEASVLDPAPLSVNFTSPYLPFTVSVIGDNDTTLPLAAVATAPFSLTHPNITIHITGTILPISSSSLPTLSAFLMKYLSGKSNPIIIASDLVSGLSVETMFPAPDPPPHLLRNVTIRDMKLKPTGPNGQFLASGTVFARIVLPKGIYVGLNVSRVLPDVLIFDGEIPENDSMTPPRQPLPDPLPKHAFAHLRPEDWLPAVSIPDESEDRESKAYAVSAKVVDVPLEVLPGRQKEFSNFVSKVIFGTDGALAGIQGSAAVTVVVPGLSLHGPGNSSNQVNLSGLPFQGSVRIGKKSLFADQIRTLQHIIDNLTHYFPL